MTMWWLNLAGSSSGFTLGSLCLKRFADTGAWTTLSVSFAIFAVSNLLFAQMMTLGYSAMGTVYFAGAVTQ